MATRKCRKCKVDLPPPQGIGRPRLDCVACSPVKVKVRRLRSVTDEPTPTRTLTPETETVRPVHVQHDGATLVEDPDPLLPVTRAALEAAGQLDHWAGRAALTVAARIDSCDVVGSPLAAMIKAHRDSMKAALGDVAEAGDVLDGLFAKRNA